MTTTVLCPKKLPDLTTLNGLGLVHGRLLEDPRQDAGEGGPQQDAPCAGVPRHGSPASGQET